MQKKYFKEEKTMAKIIIDITNEDEEFETFVKIRKVDKYEEPKIKDARRHERRAAIAAKRRSW